MDTQESIQKSPHITIVIPAYNEEESLQDVVTSVESVMKTRYTKNYTIIILDDASTDKTNIIAQDLAKKYHLIVVIRNDKNYGKNQSLVHAFESIKSGIICFIDADKQYFAEDIPLLIEKIKNGADIACGRRARRKDSIYRKIMSFSFNRFNRIMFSIKIHDINCGMKAFEYEKFIMCQPQYNQARWFFDTELLARAYRKKLKIEEVLISHRDRPFGRSKVNCILLALETIFYAIILKTSFLFKKDIGSINNREHG